MRLPRVTVERREKRSQAPVLRTIIKYLCCLVLQEQIKAPTPPYWLDSYWKRVSKASEKSKEWGEREPGQRDAEAKRGNVTKRGRPTPPKGWWDKKNKKKNKKKNQHPLDMEWWRSFLILKHAVLEEWLDRSQNALGTWQKFRCDAD